MFERIHNMPSTTPVFAPLLTPEEFCITKLNAILETVRKDEAQSHIVPIIQDAINTVLRLRRKPTMVQLNEFNRLGNLFQQNTDAIAQAINHFAEAANRIMQMEDDDRKTMAVLRVANNLSDFAAQIEQTENTQIALTRKLNLYFIPDDEAISDPVNKAYGTIMHAISSASKKIHQLEKEKQHNFSVIIDQLKSIKNELENNIGQSAESLNQISERLEESKKRFLTLAGRETSPTPIVSAHSSPVSSRVSSNISSPVSSASSASSFFSEGSQSRKRIREQSASQNGSRSPSPT